jgi:hypothetical protein
MATAVAIRLTVRATKSARPNLAPPAGRARIFLTTSPPQFDFPDTCEEGWFVPLASLPKGALRLPIRRFVKLLGSFFKACGIRASLVKH